MRGVLGQRGAGVPHGREAFDHAVGDQLFAVDTADGGRATVSIDLFDDRQRRKYLVKIIDRTHVWIAGVGAAHAGRIGDHGLEFLPDDRFRIGQIDRIAVTLAHFAPVRAQYFRKLGEMLLRVWEDGAIEAVESAREFAGELEMRELVFADRHEIGLIEEDVRGLQDRVSEKAIGAEVAFLDLFLLFLVGRIAFQPRDGNDHREQQMQDGVVRHLRLDEDRRALRVDAGCKPIDEQFPHKFPDPTGVGIVGRQRMPIGYEEESTRIVPAARSSFPAHPASCQDAAGRLVAFR